MLPCLRGGTPPLILDTGCSYYCVEQCAPAVMRVREGLTVSGSWCVGEGTLAAGSETAPGTVSWRRHEGVAPHLLHRLLYAAPDPNRQFLDAGYFPK